MSSKATDTMACPACGSELTLEHLLGSADDERAFARLVALSVPLADLVLRYVNLFTPPKQRLTLRKKVRLIAQLLPDLQRGAITHKGRDWAAPHSAWAQAIEQMLSKRAAGSLQLPMTGHGYLYAVLAGMADKLEGQAEAQHEADARASAQARAHRSDAPTQAGALLTVQQALGAGIVPMARSNAPAPVPGTSPTVRAMRAHIAKTKGQQ